MTPDLYQLLAARARGRCECGECGLGVPPGEIDHFFSRGRAEENEFSCWVLRPFCHQRKSLNHPSAAHWLLLFIKHCKRYSVGENGYVVWGKKAEEKLAWLRAKGTSGEAA